MFCLCPDIKMSRYQEAYKLENIKGPGDERPTALQIIQDEKLEGALHDKVILVTGTSAGLGTATARAFAATGAHVFLGVRDITKARKVHADILSPKVELLKIDLSDLDSVREAAKELIERSGGQLNILVNNAGVLAPSQLHTAAGLEIHLAVHYWGPFLLFQLVKSVLISSSSPSFPSRVVNVASKGHQYERIDFEDLHLKGKKGVFDGYGRTKLAQVYMASEIERRYGSLGLHAYSLDPGVSTETELVHHAREMFQEMWEHPMIKKRLQTAEQGAATTVWAAVSRDALGDDVKGRYVEQCAVSGPTEGKEPGIDLGYAEWAYDLEDARRLWDASFEVVGLQPQ
jgi:NAD(P)-dependent dehydrogenase (short-subunit alcohol dehydrogenase family)